MLSNYVNENQTNWDIYLPLVLFAYRTSEQKSTKETPFKLLFAREARLPADVDRWTPNQGFLENIDQAWKEAKSNITKAQENSKRLYNSKYKNLNQSTTLEVKIGDKVRLENPVTKVGLKKKLRKNLWEGPYDVTGTNKLGNVQLQVKNNRVWYHKNRVKPAEINRRVYTTQFGRKTNFVNYKE